MNPIILVAGKNGQLGSELQQLEPAFPQFIFQLTDRSTLDITDKQQVDEYFAKYKISFCINAAAYTAVDKAEAEKETALFVNEQAVANLASACKQHNARLIHVSTDYVFDGNATIPYTEDHPVSPVNFYGETKLKGEQAAMQDPSSIVIRTSWVYSHFGNNFVKTMLRLMRDRDSLNVVNDQVGSPTNAADLAKAILDIIVKLQNHPSQPGGIYHYSNEGVISWFQFAEAIASYSGTSCKVGAIPSSAYPTPAKRPAYSVLNKEKIKNDFQVQVPHWKESLDKFFKHMAH
ncbi:dTDP-4-dehydrorhamnose reductase [Aridibaculum aurantiacum]|uniref:dTDP-4-dehydrorhamnose reductase n=1 Tax=Aridibaculum aurantiacum TaxID=2810307 RepID=UPI001A97580D|nr:dTDP-4-dehydrorhamnose reductase [Aridibaculum aurantiacum]